MSIIDPVTRPTTRVAAIATHCAADGKPKRFRHAHHYSLRDEEPPPRIEAVGKVLRRLDPVAPDQPHLLMAPDELAHQLGMADMLNGKLAHWYLGAPDIVEPVDSPLGEAFEQGLEEAKHASAPRQPSPQNDDPFSAQLSPNLPPRASHKKPERDR